MPEVNRSKSCGNSPKSKFAESIAIAIAIELKDQGFLAEVIAPDLVWEMPDGAHLSEADAKSFIELSHETPVVVSIDQVVTHGKAGVVNGVVEMESGSLKRFCHVMEFSNVKCDKVRRFVSYEKST